MFTIIFDKETGFIRSISSGEPNEEELRKAIPENCDYIVVEELLYAKPYRERLIVKNGALFVETLELTEKELQDVIYMESTIEINELKRKLTDSDYKVMKYVEGQLSEEEFTSIKAERQAWRNKINELEESIKDYIP